MKCVYLAKKSCTDSLITLRGHAVQVDIGRVLNVGRLVVRLCGRL